MGYIPAQNARMVFTTVLANIFEDFIEAPSFLRSFAKEKVYRTKTVQLLARRSTEKVAVDIIRGDKGNYNKMDRFTGKEYLPPYYKELISISALDIYDIPFYSGDKYNTAQIEALAMEAARGLSEIKKKVDRAIELQMSQVFETGIVLIKNGDSIDYKRDSSMIEVLAGGDLWDAASVDIIKFFEDKAALLRSKGKVSGGETIDVVMGMAAWQAFRKNAYIIDGENLYVQQLVDLSKPRVNSTGGSYKGTLKAGAYSFDIWTYDEVYDNASDVSTRYFNTKFCALIPKSFQAEISFAQVPKLPDFIMQDPRSRKIRQSLRNKMTGFDIFDSVNAEDEIYNVGIKAAPLAQLISVDRIYTAQVLA